jgi:hypothetical protein
MMQTEKQIMDGIRREAEQAPDVWNRIERRIGEMEKEKPETKRNLLKGIAAAAAVAAVAAAVFFLVHTAPANPASPAKGTEVAANSEAPAATVSPAGSSGAETAENGEVRQPTPFYTGKDMAMTSSPALKIKVYGTIAELLKSGDVSAVHVRLTDTLGSAPAAGGDPRRIYTTYAMQVVKPLAGGLKAGDAIKVQTLGGATKDVWIEDNFVEKFTDKFEYVLFLVQNEDKTYSLASPMQGYVPLLNGKVSLNTKIKDNGLFTQGETQDELYKAIEDAEKTQD